MNTDYSCILNQIYVIYLKNRTYYETGEFKGAENKNRNKNR